MHVHAFVSIDLRDFKSTRHIYWIYYIGCARTVLQSRSVFKVVAVVVRCGSVVKVVAVVVLFSVHSLLLECSHSYILK